MWKVGGGDVKPGDVIGDAKLAEKPVEVVVNVALDRCIFCVVHSPAFTPMLECAHILIYLQ